MMRALAIVGGIIAFVLLIALLQGDDEKHRAVDRAAAAETQKDMQRQKRLEEARRQMDEEDRRDAAQRQYEWGELKSMSNTLTFPVGSIR